MVLLGALSTYTSYTNANGYTNRDNHTDSNSYPNGFGHINCDRNADTHSYAVADSDYTRSRD